MNNNSDKQLPREVSAVDTAVGSTHVYQKPVLQVFGDVRDVTLGPTPGLGESGCECVFRAGGPGATCPVDCNNL